MSIVEVGPLEVMVGDPDDHRPASRWGPKVDPGGDRGRVDTLAIITEEIAQATEFRFTRTTSTRRLPFSTARPTPGSARSPVASAPAR